MSKEGKSPFTEHLGELRDRLVRSFIAVGLGFAGAYFFKEKLFELLTAPLIIAMGVLILSTAFPEQIYHFFKQGLYLF